MRTQKFKNKILIWTILGIVLAIGGFFFYVDWAEIQAEPINSWTEDPQADCAVVLTGGPGRLREGFSLLSRKLIKKLIISGVRQDAELREIFPLWPIYGPMSEEDVVLEKRSTTTYGNAQQTLPLVEALNCRTLVLVTSKVHMPRAYRTFKKTFPKDFPIYKHSLPLAPQEMRWLDLTNEILKSFFYSLWAY